MFFTLSATNSKGTAKVSTVDLLRLNGRKGTKTAFFRRLRGIDLFTIQPLKTLFAFKVTSKNPCFDSFRGVCNRSS